MEIDPPGQIRSPPEVARRALSLFAVVAVALGGDREEIIEWLHNNGLFEDLSSMEARFIEDPEPSRREIINASWYSERLITLLWALGLASMPPADEQCDTSLFQDILPPYAEVSESDFINSAKLWKDDELMAMADQTLDLHWEARDAEIHRRSLRNVNLGIIQERHHAINWVIGYDGLAWDEVTTDT